MDDMNVHPRTIREWRANLKISKSDMARMMKVHPTTYANMEEYPENISIRRAVELAEIFGCTVGKIIFFENNRNLNLDIADEG